MVDHRLTKRELGIIREVLAPYADRIRQVGLFGSRATGTAQPGSDIDLVLYGQLDEPTLDRLWTLFDDSGLARKVDVLAYDLITYPPLKAHIDAVMMPLFDGGDLRLAVQNGSSISDT